MPATTTPYTKMNLTPTAAHIIALLHQRQYEAVERAMGKNIIRPKAGPYESTFPRMAERIPGTNTHIADYSPLPADSGPPTLQAPHLTRRIARVAPFPNPTARAIQGRSDGSPGRAERYRQFVAGRTLAEAVKRGATRRDVRWVLDTKLVTLEGVS